MRRAKHTSLALAVVLLVLGIATTVADGGPTGLFKANGHRLYLTCVGKGKPVVILDAGLGSDHSSWSSVVQRAGALRTQVCSYDRYAVGLSDGVSWTPPTRTIDQSVSDLHALVRAAKLKRPYVFVAHSIAGLVDREYARRYPKDVAGMVLLDTAPDDWNTYTGTETFAYASESLNVTGAASALQAHDFIGAKPLVVAEAGDDSTVASSWASGKTDFQAYWNAAQRSLARISHNSIFVVATKSDHGIPQTAPGLTVETVRLVVNAVRTHKKLPRCAKTKLPKLGGKC
ncbi:MAG: alpha/beta hydrolase [Gaiellaceae bacterium]|jgi:pimeloyl-ACP methyl ester carboxylesterase